jgi:SAM-dependent methyltransferase
MDAIATNIQGFVDYVATLRGDEKGEAQVFCERLFNAFGHDGYKAAGATLEERVKGKDGNTKFADLVWKPRMLLEMKSRGENLQRHYRQAFDYWINLVPNRPRYVVLCNFDEFWIYDFDAQLEEPVDRIKLEELPRRYTAFNFLFPDERKPLFGNDRVAVTREAADKVAWLFNSLVGRGEKREVAQRFVLQCVIAMFAEDAGLLPTGAFSQIVRDCAEGQNSYDLIGGLFRQMNTATPARAGRYEGVPYFNGGVFAVVEPVELDKVELEALQEAVKEDWSKVQPVIFGSIFEASMDAKERHAFGAHYTTEADIMKIVVPTITRPWQEKIEKAKTLKELTSLRDALLKFRVLDPACGSGNFLYVAYRELKHIEIELLRKIHTEYGQKAKQEAGTTSLVSTKQFYGIDNNVFAVELAKVTLMLAKELAIEESKQLLDAGQMGLGLELDAALPLENLDKNILCADALFSDWPEADAIIGNPPYLGSRYLAKEHGYDYANKIYDKFPDVAKMADYCVYWYRLAHDHLPKDGRAGLVGTNTIRQNESREATLDYIIDNGGTITEAVSTQVWSGEAAVHVSIVNWVKGKQPGLKKIFTQLGDSVDSDWKMEEVDIISGNLSTQTDTSEALPLKGNDGFCFTGQNPVNEGFFLQPEEAHEWLKEDPKLKDVLFPYMIGRDLLDEGKPTRWIIDMGQRNQLEAMQYGKAFERLKEKVMPVVLEKAAQEKIKTGKEITRYGRLAKRWWQFYDYRPGTVAAINSVSRYIACSRVTKRPIFEFVSKEIHADTALVIFKLPDDYSFGILQSSIHAAWFKSQCSTLKGDSRYTSDTVFDPFPWPQNPSADSVQKVAVAAKAIRDVRNEWMRKLDTGLRGLYRSLDTPGQSPLRDAQEALDTAVRAAYGMKDEEDALGFLLKLNQKLAAKEAKEEKITAPGLPPSIKDKAAFVTNDAVTLHAG